MSDGISRFHQVTTPGQVTIRGRCGPIACWIEVTNAGGAAGVRPDARIEARSGHMVVRACPLKETPIDWGTCSPLNTVLYRRGHQTVALDGGVLVIVSWLL
ncbi:hypothetical protein [Streptomyces triculaminicus]|uniref:hypothetical protein n=1 Tax=Streptomyces triculaminicus TaxID=2816232 RepID=UPI0037CFCA68